MNINQNQLVSVITALYNSERFVEKTIKSVISQTYPQWEMIIVNDGSTDRSAQIALDYAKRDERIKVITQPNAGSAAARNNGIRQAAGRYIALLDSDDVWDSNFLESQLAFMQQTDGKLVCAAHRRVNEKDEECLKPFYPPREARYHDLLKTCSISCLTALYDTQPYGKVYLREELSSLRDDYALWLDLVKKVGVVYGNQQILASYRMLNSQITANKRKMIKPQYNIYRKVEKIGVLKSLYYLFCWGIYGLKKYRK